MTRCIPTVLACILATSFVAVAIAELEDVPSFTVPAFDYASLRNGDVPERMLDALERGGILALRNIPNFVNVRERYLTSAVNCAVTSEIREDSARYLSTKQFHDGTRRLTLRAAAGDELSTTASEEMDANCPGHHELHLEFSRILERAVDTFASALDRTEFTVGDGETTIPTRKLVADARRLDHFHAYEAATTSKVDVDRRTLSAEETERDLSLAMHEDHGLFIAMVAPKFFSVSGKDGIVRERQLVSKASGLVIGSHELEEIVRPVLKDDELVLMIGSGASRWLKTSHHLPAVMHGMRMPQELLSASGSRHLRAWFGKMTLLPAYQRVLGSRMDFDEFTNRTTRHLMAPGSANDDLQTIGCASGRHLVESEGSCTYSICTLKAGVERPPTVGCNQACNYHTEFFDAKCEKKCDCSGTTTAADVCWMLCVARLPEDECALEDQECSGLKMVCTANTTTETPTPTPTPTPTELPVSTTETPVSTNVPAATTETPVPTTQTPTSTTNSPVSTDAPESTTATPSSTTEEPAIPVDIGNHC